MNIHSAALLRKSFTFGILLLTTSTWAAPSADLVKTENGQVKGATANGIVAFKGIPFALPPLGDLRWRAPQPAKAWTGVRAAEKFAPDCMQEPFPSDAAPLSAGISEDCLYVNVWAPASARKNLPVIVWIYGGGFVNGGTTPAV